MRLSWLSSLYTRSSPLGSIITPALLAHLLHYQPKLLPRSGPHQDAAVAQLLRTIESLQHQQEVAEAARLVADGDAQLAYEGMAGMELQLHRGTLGSGLRSAHSCMTLLWCA